MVGINVSFTHDGDMTLPLRFTRLVKLANNPRKLFAWKMQFVAATVRA